MEHGVRSGATILVIDDDPNALEIVTCQLEQAGDYRIVTAPGGQAGLECIATQRPDLIILDLMMPQVDGFAVLEQLAHDSSSPSIPIIILTAKDLSCTERQALNGRVGALLMKGHTHPEHLFDNVAVS